MSDIIEPAATVETVPARLVYHPDSHTITVQVQGNGHSIVIATIPADSPVDE